LIVWLPTARLEVLKLTVVTPPAVLSVPRPRLVDPSENVTVPVGLAAAVLPGLLTVTVTMKVTDCPETKGLAVAAISELVLAWLTISVKAPALPWKLLSPE
jgi:hypothetical protein